MDTPGELVPFPHGFFPREGIREDDYSVTGGIRGTVSGFHFDLSGTYGQDKNLIYTYDSANRSLFIDTHFTPTDFYNGMFKSTEFTGNADFSREFDVGMAGPLNVAFGGEYRKNTYTIGSGDAGSIYKEGGQSYPGFRPTDAGEHTRENESLYLDIAANPTKGLKLDGAVRYEHYTDFGDKVIFKANGRYDFSDMIALRGTVSTGFRAPTLAEEYYSATNVSPTSATVQLPANSAAAKLLGFSNLQPEKSTDFSAGLVFRPAPRVTVTLDAYQVKIKDRILGTGTIAGLSDGTVVFGSVNDAIAANGNVLDPTVSNTGISIFTNGGDTRTRGVELTASYLTELGPKSSIAWTLSGNYNETKLTKINAAPQTLILPGATQPIPLFDAAAISYLETDSPKVKVIASALVTLDRFSATLRGTIFGKTSDFATPDLVTYYKETIGTAFVADAELSYKLTENFEFTVGANNLFNKLPPRVQLVDGSPVDGYNNNVLDERLSFSPYGINGGYYYAKVGVKF